MSADTHFDSLANALQSAVKADSFKTLAKILELTGLLQIGTDERSFTVFAPTDAAFAEVPAQTLAELIRPENKAQLIEILGYHVIPGGFLLKDIPVGIVVTMTGENLSIQLEHESVRINDAIVIQADITAKDGVVHIVDKVLLPRQTTEVH
ncbi:MAG: fasciclin domain-containing protein [Gemmatimonadaceae bacterium]|nr:fasciclin domain-containing protein [Gloeobacterales cyanobacterium ES-bin-141]